MNAIATPDDLPTIVDWTNAGRGPKVWSLGFALWAAGARDLRLVDAFVSGYARHATLTEAELTALPVAIGARPLTMTCWSLAVGRSRWPTAVADVSASNKLAQTITDRTRNGFRSD